MFDHVGTMYILGMIDFMCVCMFCKPSCLSTTLYQNLTPCLLVSLAVHCEKQRKNVKVFQKSDWEVVIDVAHNHLRLYLCITMFIDIHIYLYLCSVHGVGCRP